LRSSETSFNIDWDRFGDARMKYKEVTVLRYEIGAGEMRKEWKCIKTIPGNNWDWRKREGNERKRGK